MLNVSYNPLALNAWGTPHSALGNLYLFTGRQLDEESGLYFYRARYYIWAKGRFLQRDPFGYVGGMNLYDYVDDRPTFATDPMGQAPVLSMQNEESSKGKCGVNALVIDWALSEASAKGGHVVQLMTVRWSIKNCSTHKEVYGLTGVTYWEAWDIAEGARQPNPAEDGWTWTDNGIGTYGEVTMTGKARFYEGLTRLPGYFVANNPNPQCIRAGNLPCAPDSQMPALWKQLFNDPRRMGLNT